MPSYHSFMSQEQAWTESPTSFRNFLLLLLSLPCWAETIPALCLILSSLLSALLSLSNPSTALQSCYSDHLFFSQTRHAASTAPFAPSEQTISHFYFTSHAILFLIVTVGRATFVWAWIRWCPAHQLPSIPVLGSCHQPISATHQICTSWQQSSERLDGDRNYFSDGLVSSLALVFDCGGCLAGFG